MFRTAVLFSLVFALAPVSAAAEQWPGANNSLAWTLLDSLQVERVDIELSENPTIAGKQLWDLFANRPLHERYSQLKVPFGEHFWPVFSSRLMDKVKEAGFDVRPVRCVLDSIAADYDVAQELNQLLPFGAFLGTQNGEDVWMIPCNWEHGVVYDENDEPCPIRARHIRVWAYTSSGCKRVGYTTCK